MRNKKRINVDYVAALVESNGTLVRQNIDIPSIDFEIEQLQAIVEDSQETSLDLQRYYHYCFKAHQKYYKYCLPYSYSETFINSAAEPKDIPEAGLKILLQDNKYRALRSCPKYKYKSKEEQQAAIDEKATDYEKERKEKIFNMYKRFMQCQNLYEKTKEIKADANIKMFSTENIGWTNFEYQISKDINVYLRTNFCYGRAAYFLVTIKYKDVLIVPYSYIVKYFHANFAWFTRCTHSYIPVRDNWDNALDFIAEFTNMSIKDPDTLLKKYIIEEIDTMVKGLEEMIASPRAYIERVENVSAESSVYQDLRNVRSINSDEEEQYKLFPNEFDKVYVLLKISGALQLLENIKKIAEIIQEVNSYIDKIEDLNTKIQPNSELLLKEIEEGLGSIQLKINEQEKKKNEAYNEYRPYMTEVNIILRKLNKRYKFDQPSYITAKEREIEIYSREHPEYTKIKQAYYEEDSKLRALRHEYRLRDNLRSLVSSCIEEINNYFAKKHEPKTLE